MLSVTVEQSLTVSEKIIAACTAIAGRILQDYGKSETEVSLYFTTDAEIRVMNREYRNKDQSTDVLSFPLEDGLDSILGEIIISYETADRQREQHSIEEECIVLFVHGMFHLLGYDHETDGEYQLMHEQEMRYVPHA